MLGSPARDGRTSLTRRPASRTSSPPAIQSHGWSTDSKYASNRPLATYARSSEADPRRRTSRTSLRTPARMRAWSRLSSAMYAKPVATSAVARSVLSVTRRGRSPSRAPPPRVALKSSSRSGSYTTPASAPLAIASASPVANARVFRAIGAPPAVVDGEARRRAHGRRGRADRGHRTEVGREAAGLKGAAHVSAMVVEELELRVPRGLRELRLWDEGIPLRADGRAEQLRRHSRRGRVREIAPEVVHEVHVAVAREHDWVLRARQLIQDQLAVGDVTHPVVDTIEDVLPRIGARVLLREAHRLRDEVPVGSRSSEPGEEPGALLDAEHRALGIDARRAVSRWRLVLLRAECHLGGTVLPGVEHVERGEIAERDRSIELELWTLRSRDADGHVLVEGLVTRGALRDRLLVARIFLVDATRVVVLDLVVVPCDDPRESGVRGLKILVGPVLRVPIAVVGEAEAPAALRVLPDDVAAGVALVDVVPEEEHDVKVLACDGGVSSVVAMRVVLARGESEAEI